ncbi:pyridoxamine 5'-phosphate oxidase family protein [Mesorhizobium sp.]|uniref:pyridoxamine 5'-phosphate oxidase family protein n=1 Tax=Mesorhizobium sp. TaxID=1871066 RepID=UPI000FE2D326|nr:pyridoxamine 5'-phosphate oxidase family protein [Mesorhizobium sp.]RWA61993.1 MAG: pyridoxamine 5'-phosphate oxidase family protein [Mesorhizobium sp.]RWB94535.1 MAG: pyridoxamine 5'-phosphate oxidase family protein [Mesorhizobium sp.]RWG76331.1 MAG: pyridoxamine 5'-phosphate oxidase family protein [Mesorhizobium sp.]RWG78339.1 MAG: pyridoxamine 5'-phosphate oxidase family protein [Mesorhizobium sp.]RWJ95302.1 MAG: pyridoxamine 5'-phosphate oxidase family protein [Mesorhizobium sp.]
MQIRTLSALECTKILTANRVGHLACAKDGQPYVVPFYYAHADNHLYAFSMPGKKIDWMRSNPLVSVQVEERGTGRGWRSVIVNGRYEELPDRIGHKVQCDHAWSVLSKHADWWEPGALKPDTYLDAEHLPHVFYRISIAEVSGREAIES